jgi:hypothetical protein
MLINLRNRLPDIRLEDIEDARDVAAERITKAAAAAARTAREASDLVEDWAAEGLDSVRARPLIWVAASLGLGVLVGGLFAVWQRTARPNAQAARRAVAARTRPKPKRRAPRARRVQPSADA